MHIKLSARSCIFIGTKKLRFSSNVEFLSWKEREEEVTYTTYVKSHQMYHPVHPEGITST